MMKTSNSDLWILVATVSAVGVFVFGVYGGSDLHPAPFTCRYSGSGAVSISK